MEGEIDLLDKGFAIGKLEELRAVSPHQCTCRGCQCPLIMNCFNCEGNYWKATLIGRHLQLECNRCGNAICINTELTSAELMRNLLVEAEGG